MSSRRSRSQSPKRRRSENKLTQDVSSIEIKEILKKKKKKDDVIDAYMVLHSEKLDIERNLRKLITDITDEGQNQSKEAKKLREDNSKLKLKLQQTHALEEEKRKLNEELLRERQVTHDLEDEKREINEELLRERQATHDLEDEKRKINEELLRERQVTHDLEDEKRKINKELLKERQEHWKFVHQFAKTIEKLQNKVHIKGCQNVQIGDSNIVKDEVMSQGKKSNIVKDEVMSQGQELIRKLSLSIDKHIAKRQELEMEIRNNKVMLKEMQETIKKIVSNIKNKSKILREDKELLTVLTEDRSDKRVIPDGVEQLKKTKPELQKLPPAVNAMMERLLNKFGSITCGEFVQILEGKKYNPNKEIAPDNLDQTEGSQLSVKTGPGYLREFDNDASLDKSLCVEIISKWLHISEGNDSETLLAKIEAYETKLSAELICQFQDEINSVDVSNDPKEMQQQAENWGQQEDSRNTEQSLHGLPDAISQFMHQLEGLKIVIDIDRKVDRLLKLVAEPNRHDHNSRLNRSSVSSDV